MSTIISLYIMATIWAFLHWRKRHPDWFSEWKKAKKREIKLLMASDPIFSTVVVLSLLSAVIIITPLITAVFLPCYITYLAMSSFVKDGE